MRVPLPEWSRTAGKLAGAGVLTVGVSVLLGWVAGFSALVSILPHSPKMSPLTALGFALSGVSLWLLVSTAAQPSKLMPIAKACAAVAMLIGLLRTGDYIFGWQLGLDMLGFRETSPVSIPAQMSPATALDFLLLGAALLLAGWPRAKFVFQGAAISATLIGWLGVCRFLSHNAPPSLLTSMAVHTACCFLLLGAGILCSAGAEGGLMRLLASQSAGGLMARRLLLPTLLIPLALNWFESWTEGSGWIGAGGSWAIDMIDDTVVFGALVWGNAFLLDRADLKRERAEASRTLLASIVESSDDAIIGKTLDGIITSWNHGAEKIFGYSAAEVTGQPMLILFPPERTNEEADILARIARGENVENFETVRVRKDHTRIYVSATISPVRDRFGKIVGASKIAHDITARKQADESLRASQEQLRFVTENARVGIVMVNRQRRYTYANSTYAEILGLPSADIVGQSIAEVLNPVYESQVRPRLDRAFANERVAYELHKSIGAEEHCYTVRYEPTITDHDGPAVVVVITDITARKKTEEEIRAHLEELQQWHEAMIGREDRILELKNEVNALLAPAAVPPRYPEATTP